MKQLAILLAAGLALASGATQDSIEEAVKEFRGRNYADWRAAADYLESCGERALPALLEITEHRDMYARQLAFKAMGSMEARAVGALPEVIAGIEDDRTRPPVVNFAVSYWLNQRHIDARSIPVEYTKKPDRKDAAVLDRQYRFELVLRVGPHAPEELVAMVSCDGPAGAPGPTFSESRWIAVAAVHSLEAEAALPIYREWIASEDPGVVAAGLLGLSWLEDAAAAEAPALVPLLSSEDPQLRWRAAMALQRIGSACEESAEPLAALLADEEKAARLYAAGALGVCGDTRGLAPMLELLRDKEPEFAADAARTLRFYRPLPPEAVPALADALGSRHVNVRLYALYTLGAYGAAAEPALPAIRKRCKDRIASVARAAEEALAAIEGAR